MSLNIGDQVKIIITEIRLYGLHTVQIINHEQYDGILIPSYKKTTPIFKIRYKGLKLWGRVIRIDNKLVDIIDEDDVIITRQ